MLKLVDSETPTPAMVRKSRSAHAALSSDSTYYSEPEFDADTASMYYSCVRLLCSMQIPPAPGMYSVSGVLCAIQIPSVCIALYAAFCVHLTGCFCNVIDFY